MRRTLYTWLLRVVTLACLIAAGATLKVVGQGVSVAGEWRSYGNDLANTRYSALDQINGGNFKNLEVAWRFKTDNLGPRPEFNLESTPLMANGANGTGSICSKGIRSNLISVTLSDRCTADDDLDLIAQARLLDGFYSGFHVGHGGGRICG